MGYVDSSVRTASFICAGTFSWSVPGWKWATWFGWSGRCDGCRVMVFPRSTGKISDNGVCCACPVTGTKSVASVKATQTRDDDLDMGRDSITNAAVAVWKESAPHGSSPGVGYASRTEGDPHVADAREHDRRGFRVARRTRHGSSRPGSPLVLHRVRPDQTDIHHRRRQEGRVEESTHLVLRRRQGCARQDGHLGLFGWAAGVSGAPGDSQRR